MKRLVSGILALCLCLPPAAPIVQLQSQQVCAAEVEEVAIVDGLIYKATIKGEEYTSLMLVGMEDANADSVTIPAAVNGCPVFLPMIAADAFQDCKNLQNIYVAEDREDDLHSIEGVLYRNNTLLVYPQGREGAYSIPEGTTAVGEKAFQNAQKLTRLTLPESLELIQGMAFYKCTALEEIIGAVPSDNASLFYHCSALKSVEFAEPSNSEKKIYAPRFHECDSLETIIFPENCHIIDSVNIRSCPSLKSLTLPRLVGELYIASCENLQTLNLSEVDTGGSKWDEAVIIRDCNSLEMLDISEVKEGNISIAGCAGLKQLYNTKMDNRYEFSLEDCAELESMSLEGSFDAEIKDCPKLQKLDAYGNSGYLSIANCPELTTVNCFNKVGFTLLEQVDQLTVYGEEEFRDIQSSCEEWGIPFVIRTAIKGDVNGDTEVNILDVIAVNKAILGVALLDDAQKEAADMDGNGTIDAADSLALLKCVLGIV